MSPVPVECGSCLEACQGPPHLKCEAPEGHQLIPCDTCEKPLRLADGARITCPTCGDPKPKREPKPPMKGRGRLKAPRDLPW